jgi:hypothetical protein
MFNNETYNKFNTPEIGDIFIFKKVKGQIKPCKYQGKRFKIKKISKYGGTIYYDDLRTNIKCKCSNCRPIITNYKKSENKHIEREVPFSQIEIVEKRDQYQRNLKLKLLNII